MVVAMQTTGETTGERPPIRVLRVCSVFHSDAAPGDDRALRFDPIGGMQNHTYQLTTRLDERGLSQTVVTARRPGAPKWHAMGTRSQVFRLGVPVPWARQFYAVAAAKAISRIATRADLVHAHLGEDLAVLPLAHGAARRHGLPLVVTIHCSLRHTLQVVDARTAMLKRLGGAIEDALLPKAAAVIALTERTRAAIHPAVRGAVHVIPPGADASAFAGSPSDPFPEIGRPRVVFVGRLAAAKGVDVLIEAIAKLHSRAEVVIVGDGPERGRLERAAQALPAGRVRFIGFVPHAEVPAVLAHADVLVLPSIYEELGSIIMEALQAHVPVVASDVGGIASAVVDGENGLLVAPGEPAELSAALDRVLGDVTLRIRLARGAAARAELYSWDAVADRVMAVYGDVTTTAEVTSVVRSRSRRSPAIVEHGRGTDG